MGLALLSETKLVGSIQDYTRLGRVWLIWTDLVGLGQWLLSLVYPNQPDLRQPCVIDEALLIHPRHTSDSWFTTTVMGRFGASNGKTTYRCIAHAELTHFLSLSPFHSHSCIIMWIHIRLQRPSHMHKTQSQKSQNTKRDLPRFTHPHNLHMQMHAHITPSPFQCWRRRFTELWNKRAG